MAKGNAPRNAPPAGAIIALLTAAVTSFARWRDPAGLGQDRVLRGAGRSIGLGGAIWLAWAALRRALSRRG
ncbi:hypothetical protein HOY34_05015 [Xinfangfangia sp. D13-10-4-6]|uniref:hypothetical protein n=1 Tax=Pseudogemmobacter hezensis TaxID=2737662 RepID=UPI001557A766|nr:hypothetical protein [Pseudogemmobacter hezensis]NPD14562.1 hypothetical protein [Pseudogemmobacter hezensis]